MKDILLILWLICFLLQFVWVCTVYIKARLYTKIEIPSSDEMVSIIISCKNEAENIQKNAEFWLSQRNVRYEVLLIDDRSTDETSLLLAQLSEKNEHVRIFTIYSENTNLLGKKGALTVGISNANGSIILCTDADCQMEQDWAFVMSSKFSDPKIGAVIGLSPLLSSSSFISQFSSWESLFTIQKYVTLSLIGLPYMGVGRNLAFRKEAFYAVNGYASHGKILGGDDDLLVQELSKNWKIDVELARSSYTFSEAKTTVFEYFKQKHRHLQVGKKYSQNSKLVLSLLDGSHVLFFYIPLFFFVEDLLLSLVMVLVLAFKIGISAYLLKKIYLSSKQKLNSVLYWLGDIIFALYYPFIGLIALIFRKRRW